MKNVLIIARDFHRSPGPRYINQGPWSGEAFRKLLVKKLQEKAGKLTIDLDGTRGFGSSFLDEAFGGLIRSEGFTKADIMRRIEFKSEEDDSYIDEIKLSIDIAEKIRTK